MAWRMQRRDAVDAIAAPVTTSPAPDVIAEPQRRRRPSLRQWLPWVALTIVALVAATALWRTNAIPAAYGDKQARAAASPAITDALKDAARQPKPAVAAYRKIGPSLVVIQTESSTEDGLGTGFIANADGSILTANHVVSGGGSIQVTYADGTKTAARIRDAQPENDLAVLTPETLPEVIVPAVLAGPGQVGDDVFAVGHPLGLTFSLSAGVVSAVDRTITTKVGKLDHLIQFDAAVNPGNSGGPLLNDNGQVVGVVTALANPSKQPYFIGIGFAVPITSAGGALGAPPL